MRRSKLKILDKILLIVGIFLAVGLAIGMIAGKIDPRQYIYVAFFGLAYPFFLIGNALFVLLWLFKKRWLFAVLTIGVILVGWTPLIATYQLSGEKGGGEKHNERYVRMMTYNVHQFKKYGENNDISTRDQIINVIKEESPDILCFQEFFTRRKGAFDLIDSVKKQLKLKYYYFVPSIDNDYEAAGLAIFSRYPIKAKGYIPFSDIKGNESIYVDVLVDENLFRVYNVHFQSISFQKEDYDYIDKVAKKMKPEYGSTRRIASMLKSAFIRRSHQVSIMKKEMAACTIPYVITGDFNDTPASFAVTQVTKNLKRTFVEQGSGFGKTYNGMFPNFQIDYIATTKEFDVINHYVTNAKLSDHFPVRSDLRLNFSLDHTTKD